MYPGYTFDYGGEFRRIGESLESLYQAFLIAILLIYVILVALFRSYVQPLIIMATVPLSFIGVVYGLFISNVDLSMMAFVGIIALVGIVINDSLVMIDFINRSREKGMSVERAVIESGKVRLRPIILTTLTTIGGLLPMALGVGGKEPMLTPMAVSIVWGLLFAMVLTLVVIPCLYMVVEDIKMKLTGNR
jgi:HAE1 family hydrophobic/amphiphilic exporter-1